MDKLFLIIAAVLAVIMAYGIAQNAREIEFLIKQQKVTTDVLSDRTNDLSLKNVELARKVKSVVDAENTWRQALEKNQEENRDEIKKILNRLDEISKDFGRLDDIDFRARQASAKASDVARCYMLNEWSSEEEGKNNE